MKSQTSPLPALQGLLERTVTVADVVEHAIWTIPGHLTARDAHKALSARDFDIAAVDEDPVARYIEREALPDTDDTVAELARPILASDTIEKTTPLSLAVDVLEQRPYAFVLDADRIRWILTRADLQAPAFGVVTLMFLVAIEMGLRRLVPRHLGSTWFDQLGPERRDKALELFDVKRDQNAETGLEDCLYFSDWVSLAARSPELIRTIGFEARSAFCKATGFMTDMRNALAHGGNLLDGSTPVEAIDRFRRVRAVATTVWQACDALGDRWDAVQATIFEPVDRAGAALLDRLRQSEGVGHVITAWNPDGATWPRCVNDDANSELEALLRDRGVDVHPVVGVAPDGSWSEESFVVAGLDRVAAVEIGSSFGQSAIFEIGGGELLVVRCTDGAVIRRRSLSPAPPTRLDDRM